MQDSELSQVRIASFHDSQLTKHDIMRLPLLVVLGTILIEG